MSNTPNDLLPSNSTPLKVVIAGLARNCAAYIPDVILNMNKMTSIFSEVSYVFVENDSTDDSFRLLQEFGLTNSNTHILKLPSLNHIKERTIRIEIARNSYISYIKQIPRLSQCDLLIIFDMDDVNTFPISIDGISKSIAFLMESNDRAAIFANQIGMYYDLWALRHPQLCPYDVWEEMLDLTNSNEIDDATAYNIVFKDLNISIPRNFHPIEVISAFGGLGIYKMNYVLQNSNPYLGSKVKWIKSRNNCYDFIRFQQCEHVHFNTGIRLLGGKLYIDPNLINGNIAFSNFPCSAYKHMIF